MAKTIAKATGFDNCRSKEVHRLGSISSMAEANTWHTFSKTTIHEDGSGGFTLIRNGITIFTVSWNEENASTIETSIGVNDHDLQRT